MIGLPALYAHRLGRDPGPDCSRAALRATLAGPVDGLEADVCLTADGRLAVLHDPWLRGCTTARGWAHRTTWDTLRAARLRDRAGAPTDETPMLLEELLDAVPLELALQVEVKAYGDPALTRATTVAVSRAVAAWADRERVEVLSFHVAAGPGDGVSRRRLSRATRGEEGGTSRLRRLLLVLCAFAVAGASVDALGGAAKSAMQAGSAQSPTPAPIGVFPGDAPRSVASFQKQLGRPLDYAHDYINKASWATMTDVTSVAKTWTDAGFAGRTVFTVPMLPDSGGSMAQGARGRYNERFRLLARRLVAGGQGSAVLRIGPEFNGTWFRWTIKGKRGSSDFKAYWRQIVRAVRAVQGANFRFDWSPNGGSSYVAEGKRRLRASTAYPGDAYVDYIGLDVFDQSWAPHGADPFKRWRELMTQTDGLLWHARFAAAHGKPMTFPEWGLVKRSDGRGGGDNPSFVTNMHYWFQTHPVAYHLYFESRDPNGEYGVFSGEFPEAAKQFISIFGVTAVKGPGA